MDFEQLVTLKKKRKKKEREREREKRHALKHTHQDDKSESVAGYSALNENTRPHITNGKGFNIRTWNNSSKTTKNKNRKDGHPDRNYGI